MINDIGEENFKRIHQGKRLVDRLKFRSFIWIITLNVSRG